MSIQEPIGSMDGNAGFSGPIHATVVEAGFTAKVVGTNRALTFCVECGYGFVSGLCGPVKATNQFVSLLRGHRGKCPGGIVKPLESIRQ